MTKEEVVKLYNRYIEVKKKNSLTGHIRGIGIDSVHINKIDISDSKEIDELVKKLRANNNLSFLDRKQLIAISDDDNFRDEVTNILINL